MQMQTALVLIEPTTANLLIEALQRGNKDNPVSWVMLATYAELYLADDNAIHKQIAEYMDDLLSLGAPVLGKRSNGYFIVRTQNELVEAMKESDRYTAERLEGINLPNWYTDVKRQLQMLI
ncbi:hypothetical protein [Weissella confusa]